VYKISDELALVQTLDFITPVVNSPYEYGQIAAANSLSDIFAMGAKALTALNIVAYDACHVTKEMLQEILAGGLNKMEEAGVALLGGHTIEDLEMKYGLSVTGSVHPEKIIRNNSAQPGNVIILTKPLGLGVSTTALKADLIQEGEVKEIIRVMSALNKKAAEIALGFDVKAMTDVTGFGLLGHLVEMLNSEISIEIDYKRLPFLEFCFEYAEMGLFPGGSIRNRKHFSPQVEIKKEGLTKEKILLCFDAQTSGGLLISIPEKRVITCLDRLHAEGITDSVIIGQVVDSKENKVILK
jgi:selenide,water dikinase